MHASEIPTTEATGSVEALWGLALYPAGCSHCRQAHLVPARMIGSRCPNCAVETLEPQQALLRREAPELIIPFQVDRSRLETAFQRFTEGVWLPPDDLNPQTLLERAVPVFWPMWLVDAEITGDWQAEIGYDYQVKSSQESYTGGDWRTREVVENRIRWEPRMGRLERRFNNVAVPALEDHDLLSQRVGSYRREVVRPFSPDLLDDAALRVPDLPPESAWPLAESNLKIAAADECRLAAGGQHVRSFSLRAEYDSLHWTQLLQPLYVSYYTPDDGQPQMVYVNGQTGAAGGLRLASQRKGWLWAGITAAISLGLLLLGLLVSALGAVTPPVAVLGIVLVVLGVIAGIFAVVPAIWPWQWNRTQQDQKIVKG